MDKDVIKSALFGYSKISVCQYIATMNEEFNAKLMAEAASFREERTKLQKKIDDLELELVAHKQNACDVGTMMLEAGQYAEQLRQQAQEEVAQLRQQAQEEVAQLRQQAQEETAQLRQQTQEEVTQLRQQAQEEVAQLRQQAQEEAEQILQQAQEEAEQLQTRTKDETDQFLLEIETKGQAQTQKIARYTGAIEKLREDLAILANRTDDALNAFAEQFLSLRQDFEDSE